MLRYPRCIAPALLASFVGLIATAAARAEPASAASPADADCLTKPTGQTAPGNHWYYHLDRASGRRCWYQRPESGAQNDAAPSRSVPARAAVSPPAATTAAEGTADTASDSRDQGTVEAAPAVPAQPFGWSTATPAPAPRETMTAPASDSAAPAPEPATSPQSATADAPARAAPPAAPPSRAPLRAANVERPAAAVEVEAGTHMPALLGAALALLIVVLGSIVARLAASLIRSRRRDRALAATVATATPPMFSAQDAPALVPVMPRERDVARKRRAPRLPRDTPAPRQEGARDGAPATATLPSGCARMPARWSRMCVTCCAACAASFSTSGPRRPRPRLRNRPPRRSSTGCWRSCGSSAASPRERRPGSGEPGLLPRVVPRRCRARRRCASAPARAPAWACPTRAGPSTRIP